MTGANQEMTTGKRKSGSVFGGFIKGLTMMDSDLGTSYLESYRAFDDGGNDLGLNNTLYQIISGKESDYDHVLMLDSGCHNFCSIRVQTAGCVL